VAFYDPKLGAVVVGTHSKKWQIGQMVYVVLEATSEGGRNDELDRNNLSAS
jgi:hypothetical protein